MKILNASTILLIVGLQSVVCVAKDQPKPKSYQPPAGYVPDRETATTIAIAVLTPIYGKETVEREKPFQVVEKKGVWIVTGAPPSAPGGTAEIRISKTTGQILFVTHYR